MERVELAYARHLLDRPGGAFAAIDWRGRLRDISPAALRSALAGGPPPAPQGPLAWPAGCIVSMVAHHGLHRGRAIARLRAQGARFVPAVHDLIPLELPDSTRWVQRRLTLARMRNVGRQADGVLVFSQTVRQSLLDFLARHGLPSPPILVAPLGLDLPVAAPLAPGPPYFLCIATIERRKNHAMLLEAWQRMGPTAPRLVLVGRRSFGAGRALRLLDAGALPMVEERGFCTDAELAALLAGAHALLLPSQAEGFGIPVAEALAVGTPVIASQAPALRETGQGVPDHLPADDPAAWAERVTGYAQAGSPERAAQMRRMASYRPPGWPAHFEAVEAFLKGLAPRLPKL